jgi:hypothetical protein
MFAKQIDGQDYSFRMYWDASTPGPFYYLVVEVASQKELDYTRPAPVPGDVVSKIQLALERSAGFPNVPAPVNEENGRIVRFKVRLPRVPDGSRPIRALDWIRILERSIKIQL